MPEFIPGFLLLLIAHAPFYVYALLWVFVAKAFYQRTSPFSFTAELTERDNAAFGACLTGYLVAVAIALTAAFPSKETVFVEGAITMTYSGLLAVGLLRTSIWINDQWILRKLCIREELLRDKNIGTGVAVAGSSLATGFILAGALTGESPSYLLAICDTLIYWAVGQAVLIAGAAAYTKLAAYDLHKTLEDDDNQAAGMSLGGFLLALGILVWAAIRNASGPLFDELAMTAAMLAIGAPLLLLTSVLTEKLILPKINLAKEIAIQKNLASGLMCATSSVTTAILLSGLLSTR